VELKIDINVYAESLKSQRNLALDEVALLRARLADTETKLEACQRALDELVKKNENKPEEVRRDDSVDG
jgi:hypothetical protein